MAEGDDRKRIQIEIEMSEEMDAYLGCLSAEIRDGGAAISKSKIVEAIIQVFIGNNSLDVSGANNERELAERILRSRYKTK